jgi:Rrf2 family transcriptional regulator, nitric oxide-sensitive transcriptional repressor
MRLTQFSDYALRTTMYLGAHRGRLVSIPEVASAYGVSYHHLTKVAALLIECGVIEAVRGRNGGLRLAMEPSDINIGWLVRKTEPDMMLVECFNHEQDTCPITPECKLRKALKDALRAFLSVLDEYSLHDLLGSTARQEKLVQLWRAAAAG